MLARWHLPHLLDAQPVRLRAAGRSQPERIAGSLAQVAASTLRQQRDSGSDVRRRAVLRGGASVAANARSRCGHANHRRLRRAGRIAAAAARAPVRVQQRSGGEAGENGGAQLLRMCCQEAAQR